MEKFFKALQEACRSQAMDVSKLGQDVYLLMSYMVATQKTISQDGILDAICKSKFYPRKECKELLVLIGVLVETANATVLSMETEPPQYSEDTAIEIAEKMRELTSSRSSSSSNIWSQC